MIRNSVDKWAQFLVNEKLTPARVGERLLHLVQLCERLSEGGPPYLRMHKDKLDSRRRVVVAAMDLGLDLAAIRYRGKVAMGRGLLDVWNVEYSRRFGSNVGTASAREVKRRDIVTKLSKKTET